MVIPYLPDIATLKILENLPVGQRLRAASVSKCWASLAVQATPQLAVKLRAEKGSSSLQCIQYNRQVANLLRWLRKNGTVVRTIQVSNADGSPVGPNPQLHIQMQLPSYSLQHLNVLDLFQIKGVAWIDLSSPWANLPMALPASTETLSSSNGRPALTTAAAFNTILPQLRELRLSHCSFSTVDDMRQISQLTGLTYLALQHVHVEGQSLDPGDCNYTWTGLVKRLEVASAVPQVLQQLQQLRKLKLCSMPHAWQHPSWAHLPSSLMSLTVETTEVAAKGRQDFWLAGWLALLEPEAEQCTAPDTRVAGQPNLQDFRWSCALNSMEVKQTRYAAERMHLPPSILSSASQLRSCYLQGVVTSAGQLLTAVGCMTALQSLCLLQLYADPGHALDMASLPAQHFSALTESSALTKLIVVVEKDCKMVLPRGAIQHMFPPGKVMQHLQHVHLGHADEMPDGHHDVTAAEWCIAKDDLNRIIRAAPCLSSLDVRHALQPGSLRALLQLPASCQYLNIAGSACGNAAAAVLCQLTQLTHLSWGGAKEVCVHWRATSGGCLEDQA